MVGSLADAGAEAQVGDGRVGQPAAQVFEQPALVVVSQFLQQHGVIDHDLQDAAGREAGQGAACEVCQRWTESGRKAAMLTSKRPGEDANDILRRRLGA